MTAKDAKAANRMTDDFIAELLAVVADLQRLGLTNAAILHDLASLRHRTATEKD